MDWLLNSDSVKARFVRTVIESALGFIAANIVIIVGGFNLDPATAAAVCAIVTAVISPIIAGLRGVDGGDNGDD